MREKTEFLADFDGHRLIEFINEPKANLKGFIALHRGSGEVPSFGATRIVNYQSEADALKDVLRLSRLMSYKAALAGLKYGGAKGVIIAGDNTNAAGAKKKALLKAYIKRVNALSGRFITGADAGITGVDLKLMHANSSYIVGTSTDAVFYTGLGLFFALEVCLKEIFGDSELSRRSFGILGLGKIGTAFLGHVYAKAKKIYIADIDNRKLHAVKQRFPKVRVVSPAALRKTGVDVFVPCGFGNTFNRRNAGTLKCKIIVGGANNQLSDVETGEILSKRGILYAPDYVVNAGGLIAVVDEYEHRAEKLAKELSDKRVYARVSGIGATLTKLITQSKKSGKPLNVVADRVAEKIFNA